MKGKTKLKVPVFVLVLALGCGLAGRSGFSQEPSSNQSIDEKVRSFLDGQRYKWRNENIREADGKVLYDLILKHNYKKALENFKKAGLSDYVDARLADAHELVPELTGPFDFIFVDADKEWYTNYLKLLLPKLEVGGCFTAHNVRNLEYMHGLKEFLDYVRSLPNMETAIDTSSGSGISISYKRSEK